MNPIAAVTEAVQALETALPDLLEQCTDPQALDMAELFLTIQEARKALYGIELDTENKLGKSMTADQAISPSLRVERGRAADRKEWDHDGWKRDVRRQVVRALGLMGATIISKDGEELDAGLLHKALAAVQSVHGSGPPKVGKDGAQDGGLKAFGLNAGDYCTTSPGRVTVTVTRMADETTEVETDAA